MIGVKMTTTKGELRKMAVKVMEDFRRKAIRILTKVGEEAVNEARASGNWTDRTGNLRSSIGYVITEDGALVTSSEFAPSDKGTDKATGQSEGRAQAVRIASETRGLALVVVAGMNYAVYVADKGFNVLSSSQILAEMRIRELFKKQSEFDENR